MTIFHDKDQGSDVTFRPRAPNESFWKEKHSTDSLSFSDAHSMKPKPARGDNLTLSDVGTVSVGKVISETLALNDAAVSRVGKVVSDSLLLGDTWLITATDSLMTEANLSIVTEASDFLIQE